MGKASRWFRNFFGLKKTSDHHLQPPLPPKSSQRTHKWGFGKSYREKRPTTPESTRMNRHGSSYSGDCSGHVNDQDQNKHALAVAAATAAVADAALAAAHAAAAVVRLTRGGNRTGNSGDWAALKIQSAFRGYLAKRALRALKGLVKLQALVRGHIVRNRTEDTWRRMNVLLRAQSRACAGRTLVSESPLSSSKSSHYHYLGPATPEKFEHVVRSKSTRHNQPSLLKRNGSKQNISRTISDNDKSQLSWNWSTKTTSLPLDDEKNDNDRILEIDTGKHNLRTKSGNMFHSSDQNSQSRNMFRSSDQNSQSRNLFRSSDQNSQSSFEVQSLSPLKFTNEADGDSFCTADNTPQFYSASSKNGGSRRGPFTPTKSDGSRTSYLSGYSDHPNYMSYTESSKAKLRSLSAPKQRPHFDRSSSTKRYSVYGSGELRSSKGYPGSGRLDSFGMPVGGFHYRC